MIIKRQSLLVLDHKSFGEPELAHSNRIWHLKCLLHVLVLNSLLVNGIKQQKLKAEVALICKVEVMYDSGHTEV